MALSSEVRGHISWLDEETENQRGMMERLGDKRKHSKKLEEKTVA